MALDVGDVRRPTPEMREGGEALARPQMWGRQQVCAVADGLRPPRRADDPVDGRLPLAADHHDGRLPPAVELDRPAEGFGNAHRAIGAGILQQQRSADRLRLVVRPVPDAAIEHQRLAVMHLRLDDRRRHVVPARRCQGRFVGALLATDAGLVVQLLRGDAVAVRAGHELQPRGAVGVLEPDPHSDEAALGRHRLDVGVERVDVALRLDDQRSAPQHDVIAQRRPDQLEDARIGGRPVEGRTAGRPALHPGLRPARLSPEARQDPRAFRGVEHHNRPGIPRLFQHFSRHGISRTHRPDHAHARLTRASLVSAFVRVHPRRLLG